MTDAATTFEHMVVEVERKAHDRWLVGPRSAKGRRPEHADPAEYLDGLGHDGWELVAVTPLHARSSLGGVQTDVLQYTLRRSIVGSPGSRGFGGGRERPDER